MKGTQRAKPDRNTKLSQWYIVKNNNADLCEDTDHVNDFSGIINNELTELDKIEF